MRYLVMECHLSYALVMDSRGQFLKVPNLGYTVGQQLDQVYLPTSHRGKRRRMAAILAACLCILALGFGTWHLCFLPYGSVRMEINPNLMITVNRLDRVLRVEGLNDDGETLLAGYSPQGGTLEAVAAQLADRAMGLGYLKQGGVITITALSPHGDWRAAAQNQLILGLSDHLDHQVTITTDQPSDKLAEPDAPKEPDVPAESPPREEDDDNLEHHHNSIEDWEEDHDDDSLDD